MIQLGELRLPFFLLTDIQLGDKVSIINLMLGRSLMFNAAAAWLVVLVVQFGEPSVHIVEFPHIEECKQAEDELVDILYTNDDVATVEHHCFFRN